MEDERKTKGKDSSGKLSRKVYERELATLSVEMVKLQEWVKREGKKICIVFEGRDGAGKGGVIKAMTACVSPRTFHVIALAAPTEREKSQMYIQRYVPHSPAAGEVVIFDRSWYNRAGIERVMGFSPLEKVKEFLEVTPGFEKMMVESGNHSFEILAGGQSGGADAAAPGADRGRTENLEAVGDGSEILQPLVRLFACARRDVFRHRHRMGALVRRPLR